MPTTTLTLPAEVQQAATFTSADSLFAEVSGETRRVTGTAVAAGLGIDVTAAAASADAAEAFATAAATSAANAALATGQNYFTDLTAAAGLNADPMPESVYAFGRDAAGDGGGSTYRATTAADLAALVYPEPASDVALYMPLNGPEGFADFPDLSASPKTVTVTGAVHADSGQAFYGHKMAYFDGASDQLSVADDTAWRLDGNFTVQLIVNIQDTSVRRYIIGQDENSSNQWYLRVETTGALTFNQIVDGTTVVNLQSSFGAITPGQTHDVRVCRDGNDVTLYIDSDDVDTGTVATATYTQSAPLLIGSDGSDHFQGWLGRIMVRTEATWLTGYDVDVSGQVAGPTLPRPEFHHFPEEGYFLTAEGTYYANAAKLPTLLMFGGASDAVITRDFPDTVTGTDCTDAFDALVSYMAVRRTIGQMDPGNYLVTREPVNSSGRALYGYDASLTHVCEDVDAVWRLIGDGSEFHGIEFRYGASESSGTGRGDRHSGVIGDQFWTNGAPVQTRNVKVKSCTFHAYNFGTAVKNAVVLIGDVKGFEVEGCKTTGSPEEFDRGELYHWGGEGEGYQASASRTFHVRHGKSHNNVWDRCEVGGFYSATAGIRISENLRDGVKQAYRVFSGDESNRIAAENGDTIGTGLVFSNNTTQNVADESTYAYLYEFSSISTSTVEDYASPNTGSLKDQLDQNVVIQNEEVVGSPNTGKTLLRAFEFEGLLRADIRFREWAGPVVSGFGSENLDLTLNGVTSYDGEAIVLDECEGFDLKGKVESTDLATATVVRLNGSTETRQLDTAVVVDDTTITLDAVLVADVYEGQEVLIDGISHRSTAFVESGNTSVPVTPILADTASGEDVIFVKHSSGTYDMKSVGGRYGVVADASKITTGARAAVTRFGETGFECQTSTDVHGPLSDHAGGLNKAGDGTLNTASISVDTTSRFHHMGGALGREGDYINYCVRVPGAEDDNVRYIGVGVDFDTAILGEVTDTSATDYCLRACSGLGRLNGVAQNKVLLETA